jgi:hypothetical protein
MNPAAHNLECNVSVKVCPEYTRSGRCSCSDLCAVVNVDDFTSLSPSNAIHWVIPHRGGTSKTASPVHSAVWILHLLNEQSVHKQQ